LIHFFPDWFYGLFSLPFHLAVGMAWHFFFKWFFAINGIAYVGYLLLSGEWRYLQPDRQSFRDAISVTLYELHLRKSRPTQGKYNAAQRIAYSAVVLMAVGSVITGLATYKPVQLGWLDGLLGGYQQAVGMETPGQEYYVGLDMRSALRSQTLLCYEMNGAPLAIENGAPLRLVIPTKYGIKNIKRIGTITYTDQRPADYWAEEGYDWYAGL
jgi:hypothetical protein